MPVACHLQICATPSRRFECSYRLHLVGVVQANEPVEPRKELVEQANDLFRLTARDDHLESGNVAKHYSSVVVLT